MPSVIQIRHNTRMTGHRAAIFSLVPGEDEGRVLSGAGDGWVVSWKLDEPDNGKLIARVETQIFSMLHLPERATMVVGNMNGGVHWVKLDHPEQNKNILHHKKGVFAIQQLGESVLTAGGAGVLTRWSVEEERAVESLQLSGQSLRSIAYSPARDELAIGASDNCIYLLNATTLALKDTLPEAHENSVFCLAYHPEKPLLFSGGRDAHLKVWDLDHDKELISDQPAHWFTINDMAFAPHQPWLATASRDKSLKIWDANTFDLIKVLEGPRDKGHLNSVNKVFWTPDGKHLLSAGDDRSIILWDVSKQPTP